MNGDRPIATHAEEVLDRLFAFREEHSLSTGADLLALLDYGLLHHYYLASLALCPSNSIQHNYAQDHFNKIYTNREYLKIELAEKYFEAKSKITIKEAYRLLNLTVYLSKSEDIERCLLILKDFPELILPFAISLNYSLIDKKKINQYLAIIQSVGDMEVASIAILNALMCAPDSVGRSKINTFNRLKSKDRRRSRLYKLGYQLIIAYRYRNTDAFKTILEKLTVYAPGYKLPFDVINEAIASGASFLRQVEFREDWSDSPYFMDIWASSLKKIEYNKDKTIPLSDARLVKDISDYQDIIPLKIRHQAKLAVAQLFYRENELTEFQKILRPISDSIIDYSVVDNDRIDPFQYELYVENIISNAKTKTPDFRKTNRACAQRAHLVVLSGLCGKLDSAIAEAICILLRDQLNCEPIYIGYSDIIETMAKFCANQSNSDLYAGHQPNEQTRRKCWDFIQENISAIHSNKTKRANVIIWHETKALDFISTFPELNDSITIIDISPKRSHYIYNCVNHLPYFTEIENLTPLIGDYKFYLLERDKLQSYLIGLFRGSFKTLKVDTRLEELESRLRSIALEILGKVNCAFNSSLADNDRPLDIEESLHTIYQKLSIVESDIKYKFWVLQNKEELIDVE